MNKLSRKDFLELISIGAAALIIPSCLGLASCQKNNTSASSPSTSQTVDFTVDVSSGNLSKTGGYIVQNGVIIARTNSGTFIAVASACTHQGGILEYVASSNNFYCPLHGARFSATGSVTSGPANTALQKFNTTLTGTSLRVFS